ncbi:MAG: F420-dependent NADP oxidoreductase [Bacteroidales bacterium]
MYTISFIGAGNVAFRLSIALQIAGHTIKCICNRNIEKAEQIVRAIRRHKGTAVATSDFTQIPASDIIIIAVSDSAISNVVKQLNNRNNTLIVHTSGASPLSLLKDAGLSRYGVFYPLMTLSRNKDLDSKMIPFLLEASGKAEEKLLIDLVGSLKAEYRICNSQKRLQMHTAAVFSTNFINYMLSLSYDISYPDFTFLLPCAIETVRKAFLNTPSVSQTGPAIRADQATIEKHLQLLKEKDFDKQYEVYQLLTKQIMEKYSPNKESEHE